MAVLASQELVLAQAEGGGLLSKRLCRLIYGWFLPLPPLIEEVGANHPPEDAAGGFLSERLMCRLIYGSFLQRWGIPNVWSSPLWRLGPRSSLHRHRWEDYTVGIPQKRRLEDWGIPNVWFSPLWRLLSSASVDTIGKTAQWGFPERED